VRKNNSFTLYLAGQGISGLGDSIRFIAVTMLIFNITGSGVSTALGVVFSTIPNIVASPFSGVLGDRTNERRLLAMVDLVRLLPVLLLLYVNNAIQIYVVLILLAILDVFYGPSRRKFILGITGREGALKANSMLAGVSGAAYLAGSPLAGFITDRYGPFPAIMLSGVCFIISFVLTVLACSASRGCYKLDKKRGGRIKTDNAAGEFLCAVRYCVKTPDIGNLLVIGFITGFCMLAVNLAFYPYAFDVLRVTAKGWGFMMTIYYGTNLLAMLIVRNIEKKIMGKENIYFYAGMMIVAVIWALYAVIKNYADVLLLQFIEGSAAAFCSILLAARFQAITDMGYMARVSGINDILSSAGKITGMVIAGVLTGHFSYGAVFVFNSAILLLYSFSGLMKSRW